MGKVTPIKTFNEYLYENEVSRADRVYLRQPINGVWHEFTWAEVMRQARILVTFLKDLGLKPGDKVSILSKNCAEWFICDFAIAMGGFISIPLYAAQSSDTIRFVLEHAEVKAIFVGKLDNWGPQEAGIPDHIIRASFPYDNPMPAKYHWDDIMKNYEPDPGHFVPKPEDLYTIIYTSGTTGNPKGVMISHRTQANLIMGLATHPMLTALDHHDFISYLPLGHIFERSVIESTSLYHDITISFVESLQTFAKNLEDISPTIFHAAPRILTQLQKGVLTKLPQKKLDFLLKIPIISGLIKKKIKHALGLSRAIWVISGSAPLSKELIDWFAKLDIHIDEGYGRTEDLAYCSTLLPYENAPGSVGKPHPGIEIRLSEGDELQTRSNVMMDGYYKNEEATKAAFTKDGFLRTGDQARIDENGFIYILGRIQDPFKTDKGEFVNPVKIEPMFAKNTLIEQMCLIGYTLPQPILIAVLSQAARALPKQKIEKSLMDSLNEINVGLTKFEKVTHIIVAKDAWAPENDLLTPTFKMKRHNIHAKYIDLAHKIAEGEEVIVWE